MTLEDLENKIGPMTPGKVASILEDAKARLTGASDSPLDESLLEIAINKFPLKQN